MSQIVEPALQLIHGSKGMPGQMGARNLLPTTVTDTLKVIAFLIVAIACRYYLTSELQSPTDGASETSKDVELLKPTPSPSLMDLSTVRL